MKKIVFLIVASFVLIQEIRSQDPKFLNSNQSLLHLNPSFAGSNGGVRAQFTYQIQWPEYNNVFTTYHASTDFYLSSIKGGIGISATRDDYYSGLVVTDFINISYAQYLRVCEHLLIIPSVRVSYMQKNADLKDFGTLISLRNEGTLPSSWLSQPSHKANMDFSAGGLFNIHKNFNLGIYYFHFTEPDLGLLGVDELDAQLAFYGSYNHKISPKSIMQLAVRFEHQGGYNNNQVNLNGVFYKHLVVGLGLTNFEGGTLNLGYRKDYFNLLGSFNFAQAKLTNRAVSIWEISAAMTIRKKENRHELVNFENW